MSLVYPALNTNSQDLQIIQIILEEIVNHRQQQRYQKINVANISKILRDVQSSLQLIQMLGFVSSKNNTKVFVFQQMPNKSLFNHQNKMVRQLYIVAQDAYELYQMQS